MSSVSLSGVVWDLLRQVGPGADPPGDAVRAILRLLEVKAPTIRAEVLNEVPRGRMALEQLIIAYGLGWGRPSAWRHLADSWSGVWDRARHWLEDQVGRCMTRTSRYLEFGLFIEGYAFREHPELSQVFVQKIIAWLIEGTCPCPTLFSTGSDDPSNKRRVIRCSHDHTIIAWNPEASSFLDFVWQAVKGPKPRRDRHLGDFSPKALVQGMHFWNLHHESHLRFGDVLVWICDNDGTSNFEGLPCLECLNKKREKRFDPNAFRTVITRLVVPMPYHGRYLEAAYWNCQHCRNLSYPDPFFPGTHYYPEPLSHCPKCGKSRTPGAKRSRVYLLGPREQLGGGLLCDNEPANSDLEAAAPNVEDQLMAGVDGAICDSQVPDPRLLDLRMALEELDPQARRIIELRGIEQLTLVEAAQQMGLTPERALQLEVTARKQLKAKMLDLDEEPK